MTKYLESAGVALGWTTVAAAGLVEPIVGRGKHMDLYHWDGSATNLFGPILLVFCLIWLVLTAVLSSALRPGRWRVAAWGAMLVLFPWRLLDVLTHLNYVPGWVTLPSSAFALAGLALLVALWRPSWNQRFERVIEKCSLVLQLLAFVGVFCLLSLSWMWWSARRLNDPRPLHQQAASTPHSASRPRVVWIVFDELSYKQLFEHRFPGLQLPAFDALAASSTVLTHVQPTSFRTDRALPSLMSGKPIQTITSTLGGDLVVQEERGAKWRRFEGQDTVFRDALNAGYRTEVHGWFNPYCRIIPSVLDKCTWQYDFQVENGLSTIGDFRSNLMEAVNTVAQSEALQNAMIRRGLIKESRRLRFDLRVLAYSDLMTASERDLANGGAVFQLIHLPVPHPPGFYDRRTGKFSMAHTSYVDNLALADQSLQRIRTALEKTGEWDSSAVVLMGDHSWRTSNMWRDQKPFWTKEDEITSEGGQFDDRPAYLVKLPNQATGQRIDTPFSALWTRELFDQIIQGQMRSPEDFSAWMQHHAPAQHNPAADNTEE